MSLERLRLWYPRRLQEIDDRIHAHISARLAVGAKLHERQERPGMLEKLAPGGKPLHADGRESCAAQAGPEPRVRRKGEHVHDIRESRAGLFSEPDRKHA